MEIQPKLRKVAIFTITWCFRSLTNHPFFVGFLCFLIFLQKLSPFLFSFLLSASPVLISTAFLLGTLLSFGHPIIPEIGTEEIIRDRTISYKAEDTDSHHLEKYSEQLSLLQGEIEIHREYFSDDNASLINERSPKVELENDESFSDEEIVENHYVLVPANDEHLDLEDESSSSEADSLGSERRDYVGLPSSPSLSSRTKVEDDKEEEEDWDSDSDRAESSSPDALMADITSMLHDLNPLLGEESPNQVQESFDDVMKKREDLEVGEDDTEEDEEEDTKPVITWTEEDHRNLLDLGNSETQRHVRLDNLILRMRARKMHERNLIDMESSDLPFNLSPIVTTRRNPFDLLQDPDEPPPVPGSAPSILLSRQNPFDNRYDSSEKQNLMEDGCQGDLTASKSREPFFRRHERSIARPSVFAGSRQEPQDVKRTPYIVQEETVPNVPSSSSFQRQLSEVSDYKVSSVPETGSIGGSVQNLVDSSLIDEDHEPIPVSIIQQVTREGENKLIGEISEEDMQHAQELIYKIELVSVGHESQCSEDGDVSPKYHVEESDVEFQIGDISVEHRYSRVSSSSSLSEASERVFTETDGQWQRPSFSDRHRENSAEEPGMSTWGFEQNLTVASEVIRGAGSTELREPAYDLSPRAVRNLNLLFSSTSSDVHEEPNLVLLEGSSQDVQDNVSSVHVLPESITLVLVDEHESGVAYVSDTRVPGDLNLKAEFEGVEKRSESECASMGTGVSVVVESFTEASFDENLMDPNAEGQLTGQNIHALVEPSEDNYLPDGRGESFVHVYKEPFESQSTEEHSFEHERTTGNNWITFEENETSFCDRSVHETNLEHQDSAPESNMQQVQELDYNTISDDEYTLNQDFITIPPTSFEAASHTKLQTIVEEADQIRDIDEDILSELDTIGDFSIKLRGFVANEWGEHINLSGESFYSADHIETGNVSIFELNSVQMNAIEENVITSESSDYGIDMYDEDKLRAFETCTTEHEDIPHTKFNETEGQDSTDLSTSQDGTTSVKNGVFFHSEMNHIIEDIRDSISTLEVGSLPMRHDDIEDTTRDDVVPSPYEHISDKKIAKLAVVEPFLKEIGVVAAAENQEDEHKKGLHSTIASDGTGEIIRSSISGRSSSPESSPGDSQVE